MSGQSHYEIFPRAERTQGRELDLISYFKGFQIIFKEGRVSWKNKRSHKILKKRADFESKNQH